MIIEMAVGAAILLYLCNQNVSEPEDNTLIERHRETLEFLQNRLCKELFIIDSNIWMMDRAEPFFTHLVDACKANGSKVLLPAWQFYEIVNKKNKTKWGNHSNFSARRAEQRIEIFQKHDVIVIEDISDKWLNNINSDSILLQEAKEVSDQGKSCTILTADRELRIRIREITKDKNLCEVLSLDDVLLCEHIDCPASTERLKEYLESDRPATWWMEE